MKSLPAGADNHHLVQPNPGWGRGVINGVIRTVVTESQFPFFTETFVKLYSLSAAFIGK